MNELKALLDQMYHISGVKQTDDAIKFILDFVAAKDAEIARLRAALYSAPEWVNIDYRPFCYGNYPRHKPSCLRQAALGLSEEA